MNNSKTSLGSDAEVSENKSEKEKLTKKTRKQQKANFKSRLLELDETFDQKRKSNSQVGSPRKSNSQVGSPRSQTGDESSKKLISQSDDENVQKEKEVNQKRSRAKVNKSSESVKTSSNIDVKNSKSDKTVAENIEEEPNKKETEADNNEDENEVKEKKARKRTRRTKAKAETEAKLEDENDTRILGIIVHQTDKLKTDISIYHPVVRIHIIDLDSNGEYVRKSHKDANVAMYYEKDNKKYDYIPPIMTTPFDFKEYNSMIPRWEEIIVFNEKFNHFINSSPNVLIMFEILDLFKPDQDFKHSYTSQDTSKQWQRIAWAFLKVVGLDKKSLNIEKKIRLQLFYCQTAYKQNQAESLVPEIYNIYKNGPKIKYPASLHVTIKSILPPRQFNPCLGSNFLIESKEYVESSELYNLQANNNVNEELASDPNAPAKHISGSKLSLHREIINEEAASKNKAIWSRIAGLPCRVPNELDMTLTTTKNGCYTVKFSKYGNYLACACVEENTVSTVFIYNIPSGRLVMKAYGHLGLIYEIDWSKADKYILTASNDSTARVFDVENRSKEAYKILPHPSFVYGAKFHPKSSDVVCTSGYDRVIRVWSLNSKKNDKKYGELVQEIFGHGGYVNSICFSLEGNELYSADSNGHIYVWNSYFHEETNQLEEWTQKEEMKIDEIKNQCISYIHLHPNGFRLIVHMRQNQIYLVDIRLKSVVKEYRSLFNFNQNIRSAITPCGTFLFSAGADTKIYCWNIDTGDLVTTSSVYLNYLKPARDIDFHPHDNFIVLCSYDSNAPVYLFTYNPDKAVKDLTLASNLNQAALSLARTRGTLGQSNTAPDEIYSTLKTIPAPKEESELQRRLAEENAKFNEYQTNKWKNVQERLDSVYPLERRNQNGVVKRSALASSITLSINEDNKPEFKYKGPKEAQDIVIALYDYKAQRSDELNFNKGDDIRVLVKENDNWWMGELIRTKQEGYFPAGYVQEKNVFDHNLRTNVFTQIRMPKFSARDLVSEYEKVYEENALDSISKATSKVDDSQPGPLSKGNRKSELNPIVQTSSNNQRLSNQSTSNPSRTDQVDVINEIPSRDESSRKRETPIKRRPFAHIINGNQQSSSEA